MQGSEAKRRRLPRRQSLHIFLAASCCADGLKVGQKVSCRVDRVYHHADRLVECVAMAEIAFDPWQIQEDNIQSASATTANTGALQLAQDQTTHAVEAKVAWQALDGNRSPVEDSQLKPWKLEHWTLVVRIPALFWSWLASK
jgi:hypothetical protein